MIYYVALWFSGKKATRPASIAAAEEKTSQLSQLSQAAPAAIEPSQTCCCCCCCCCLELDQLNSSSYRHRRESQLAS